MNKWIESQLGNVKVPSRVMLVSTGCEEVAVFSVGNNDEMLDELGVVIPEDETIYDLLAQSNGEVIMNIN